MPTRSPARPLRVRSVRLRSAHVIASVLYGVLLVMSAGCERSQLSDGLPAQTDCSSCHGAVGNAAPPRALNGSDSTADIGVGAHQIHMLGSDIAGPVACSECHPLPTDMLTHPDVNGGRTEMTFGPLASREAAERCGNCTASGATPEWDRTTATCKNTYCHGATLSGAANRAAPIWTVVNGSQRRCSSCRGNPPASPHPTGACESCHGDVSGPGSSIKDPTRHVDGVIDVSSTDAGSRRAWGWRFAANSTRERGSIW